MKSKNASIVCQYLSSPSSFLQLGSTRDSQVVRGREDLSSLSETVGNYVMPASSGTSMQRTIQSQNPYTISMHTNDGVDSRTQQDQNNRRYKLIKGKKKECWTKFLERLGNRDPWKIARITKDSPGIRETMGDVTDQQGN